LVRKHSLETEHIHSAWERIAFHPWLALIHTHYDMAVNLDEAVNILSKLHPRRLDQCTKSISVKANTATIEAESQDMMMRRIIIIISVKFIKSILLLSLNL